MTEGEAGDVVTVTVWAGGAGSVTVTTVVVASTEAAVFRLDGGDWGTVEAAAVEAASVDADPVETGADVVVRATVGAARVTVP